MSGNQLNRSLTWPQAVSMAVGSVIGSGILVLPAITAQEAGPASLVSWLAMGLFAIPLALTLGRLVAHMPHAGGIAAYAREAFGPAGGRLTGWLFLGTIPVGVPIIALVGANYAGSVFHLTNWAMTGLAAVLLLFSLLLNAVGVKVAAWVQMTTVALILTMLLAAIAAAAPHIQAGDFHPFLPHGWLPVGHAAVLIFWCFVGWEMVAHMAEEFRNPQRDIMLSLGLASLLVGSLYFAVSYVTVGTKAYGSTAAVAPLNILVGRGFGPTATLFTAFLALLIAFGAIHINVAGFSRMVYAQAREGDFPACFARLHDKYRTPVTALAGMGAAFSLVLLVNGFWTPNLGSLIEWPSVVFLVLYIIAMASAIKLLLGKDRGWWLALAPLVVCLALYPFSGWAAVYPPALAGLGWLAGNRHPAGRNNAPTSGNARF